MKKPSEPIFQNLDVSEACAVYEMAFKNLKIVHKNLRDLTTTSTASTLKECAEELDESLAQFHLRAKEWIIFLRDIDESRRCQEPTTGKVSGRCGEFVYLGTDRCYRHTTKSDA